MILRHKLLYSTPTFNIINTFQHRHPNSNKSQRSNPKATQQEKHYDRSVSIIWFIRQTIIWHPCWFYEYKYESHCRIQITQVLPSDLAFCEGRTIERVPSYWFMATSYVGSTNHTARQSVSSTSHPARQSIGPVKHQRLWSN